MARHYSTRSFFRQIPNTLLARYFEGRGLFGDLDFAAMRRKPGRRSCSRRRAQARQLLAREIDPSEHRKAQKAAKPERSANSFEAVGREWFNKQSSNWATSYSSRILRRLERHIFPWMGDRPVAVATAPELLRVVRRIQQREPRTSPIEPFRTTDRCFAMRLPPDVSSATQLEICGGHCHRSREPASPP